MDLKTANAKIDRVKIRQKGDKLYLRATLPCKPGHGDGAKQYELSTGLENNPREIKLALAKAQSLESEIIYERFTWENWENPQKAETQNNIETAIARHEQWYWETRARNKTKTEGYRSTYLAYFATLPLDEPCTLAILKRELLRYEADSFGRLRAYSAYQSLAKVNGIDWPRDWSALRGSHKPGDRLIPTDEQIISEWEKLNPDWQWITGMLTAYGLRPHEIFTLDLSRWPIVKTDKKTKTGERLIWPISHQHDWLEIFNLGDRRFPNFRLTGEETNRALGRKITSGFLNKKIAFCPYSLRDAFAIRCAVIGIDSAIAARLMGHTIQEHCDSYLRFIDEISTARIVAEKVPHLAGKI